MSIVDRFGAKVGETAENDPVRARKLLLAGYRLQEKRLALFPDRKLPMSGQYVAKIVMNNIIQALAKPENAAMVSIFVPGELLTAAGLTPYSVEALSCFMAGTKCEQAFLRQTEKEGFPETMCSYHRVFLGAALNGIVPKPKCMVYTNLACDGNMMTFPYLKERYEIPSFYIDVPYEKNYDSVMYVAKQLRELKNFLQDVTGREITEESVKKAVDKSKIASNNYYRQLHLRKGHDIASTLTNELYALFMCHLLAGTDESVRYTQLLMDDETLFLAYAESLLGQMPCARMNNNTRRNQLFLDPSLKGIIYHTIKFCDYYGFEYASIKNNIKVPLLKLETDFTSQSAGQLLTRIQAFAETIEGSDDMDPTKGISEETRRRMESGVYYVAGIDSGSTSTDVVILDQDGKIKSTMIIPTGGGAMLSAEKSLEKAVEKAGISKDDIVRIVTTGYGRAYINSGDDSITEITCHAKGAHYLNPNVRTVIDIGGQDIKAISIDENGAVKNFLMNDKCAAGTGRFLEMMARTLGLSLEEMSTMGLEWKENIVISSMCTVFAESEVVSLVAQNKAVSDIIHGLNMSVASKVGALAARLGQDNPGEYMMTGGVAKNKGITNALEEKLGAKLYICDEAQLCGALGAALFAYEKCREA